MGGSEERDEFAAFGPIEDFDPDWGDGAQASVETEQFVPDLAKLPLEWAPCVELAQRVCSHLNLVGVIKQIALASSPDWLPDDPFIWFSIFYSKENSKWQRGYTTFLWCSRSETGAPSVWCSGKRIRLRSNYSVGAGLRWIN